MAWVPTRCEPTAPARAVVQAAAQVRAAASRVGLLA